MCLDYYVALSERSSSATVNDAATAICTSQRCKNRMRGYMDYLRTCRVENILTDDDDDVDDDDDDDDVCCTHRHTYTQRHTYTHRHTHNTRIDTYTHIHVHTHTHTHTHTHIYAHIHSYTYYVLSTTLCI